VKPTQPILPLFTPYTVKSDDDPCNMVELKILFSPYSHSYFKPTLPFHNYIKSNNIDEPTWESPFPSPPSSPSSPIPTPSPSPMYTVNRNIDGMKIYTIQLTSGFNVIIDLLNRLFNDGFIMMNEWNNISVWNNSGMGALDILTGNINNYTVGFISDVGVIKMKINLN
jgi:hypothetical protein